MPAQMKAQTTSQLSLSNSVGKSSIFDDAFRTFHFREIINQSTHQYLLLGCTWQTVLQNNCKVFVDLKSNHQKHLNVSHFNFHYDENIRDDYIILLDVLLLANSVSNHDNLLLLLENEENKTETNCTIDLLSGKKDLDAKLAWISYMKQYPY